MKSYKSYSEYFENLVEQSVDIPHDPPNNVRGFFRINIDEVLNGMKNEIKNDNLFLVLTNYIWKPENEGQNIKDGEGMFFLMGTFKEGDYDDEIETLDEAEKVAEKFINRISLDSRKETQDENAFWYGAQNVFTNVHVVPMKAFGMNHIGVQVTFDFASHYSDCVELADWDDLNTPDDVNPNV